MEANWGSMGELVITRGIFDAMDKSDNFRKGLDFAILDFKNGVWGDTCAEDAALNNEAVKSGNDRIFAVYHADGRKIWIITEADRSRSTILFPFEY